MATVSRDVKRSFWVICKDTFVGCCAWLGAHAAAEKLGEITATKAGEKIREFFEDQRAEILEDLRLMRPDQQENLMRRLNEAASHFQERRLVRLFCKIKKTENEGRRPTLIWLNGMSDQEFREKMYLLEKDDALQVAQQASEIVRRTWQHHRPHILPALRRAGTRIDAAGNAAAPHVSRLADWLEDHGGR